MKSKFTLLILLAAVFASCKKNTNVDVKLSTSGKLTYRLTDDAGKGLSNVRVKLYDRPEGYMTTNMLLDSRLTDPNGQIDFGDLNPQNYFLIADSPKVNNVAYYVSDYVQVTTGAVKHKEVKVTDFSGTLTVSAKSYYNNQPLKNIGVLLIPTNKFNSSSIAVNIKLAEFSGSTNEAGLITFKIPSDKAYTIFAYNPGSSNSSNYSSYVSVSRDGSTSYSMNIY